MALDAKVVTFTKAVATGNQAVTGVGFQGRAVLFYAIGAAASGTWIGSSLGCIGFAAEDSSNVITEGSISWSAQHAADPTVNCRRASSKAIVIEQYDQTTRDIGTFVSFDSDGFTINWTTASADTRIIHALVLGGGSLTDASVINFARITTTGDQAVTGAGFTPDFLFGAGIGNNSNYDTDGTAAAFSFGATDGTDSFVSATFDNYNVATSSTAKGNRTGQLFGSVLNNTLTWNALASFVSFDSDGFTINWSANQGTAGRMVALCLKGGNYKVGTVPKISSASVTDMVGPATALSFEPTAVLTASCFGGTLTGNGATHAQFAMGASDGVDSAAMAMNSLSGAATASVECVAKTDKSIIKVTETSRTTALQAEAEDVGMFSNGFAWLFSTNDATASSMNFVAMGPKTIKDVTNQITNPSFEVNTAGWLGSNMTISRITSDATHGSACLKCIVSSTVAVPFVAFAGSGTGAGGTDQRRIPAVPGDVVYASAWVKAGNAGMVGQVVKLQSRGIDAVGANLGTVSQSAGVTLTTSWQQITLTSGAQPASTAAIQFLLRAELSGLNVNDEVYFDEVDVRVNQPFDVYLDGAGGTYLSWLGTANDSKSVRSRRVFTSDLVADAYVIEAKTTDVAASGLVQQTVTSDVVASGVVEATQVLDVVADGIVRDTQTTDLVIDALVQHTVTSDVVTSGMVSATQTTDVVASGMVQDTATLDLVADALVQTTATLDAVASGLVQETQTQDVVGDGVVKATQTADLTSDALVQITSSLDLVTDAYVLATLTADVIADALVGQTIELDLIMDGIVVDRTALDLVVDAHVLAERWQAVVADSLVQQQGITTDLTADSLVQDVRTHDVVADALVQQTQTHDVVIDGIVQATVGTDVVADGLIFSPHTIDLSVDGLLFVPDNIRDLITDALVSAQLTTDVQADALMQVFGQTLGVIADGVVVTRVGTLKARARIINPLLVHGRVAGELTATAQVASPAETHPHVTEEN